MSRRRIFVSYSIRFGGATASQLKRLEQAASLHGRPFIDLFHNADTDPQRGVLQALFEAHELWLIGGVAALKSPWVRLEVALAQMRSLPIRIVSAHSLPGQALQLAWDSEPRSRPGRLNQ